MPRARFGLALVAITIVAFALRVSLAQHFQGLRSPPDAESNPDQRDYEGFGWRVADGRGYTLENGRPTARRPPGASFALALPYRIFGHDYAIARVWFCLLSALACAVTGLFAGAAFGSGTGLLAALWLAFYPGHFYYPMHFLSEVPYGVAIALSCWLAWRGVRESSRAALMGAGLAFGCALLTRPQVAFALPLAFLAALASSRALRAKRVKQWLLVAVCAGAVVTPWIARNVVVLGKPTLSTVGGFTFWGANNASIAADPEQAGGWMRIDTLVDRDHPLPDDEVAEDRLAWSYGFEYLRAHKADIPWLLMMKLKRHLSPFHRTDNSAVYWTFAIAWMVTGPLLLVGLFLAWKRDRLGSVIAMLPIVSTLVTALVFYGSQRFRDADAPLFVIPAAFAVVALLPARAVPAGALSASPR